MSCHGNLLSVISNLKIVSALWGPSAVGQAPETDVVADKYTMGTAAAPVCTKELCLGVEPAVHRTLLHRCGTILAAGPRYVATDHCMYKILCTAYAAAAAVAHCTAPCLLTLVICHVTPMQAHMGLRAHVLVSGMSDILLFSTVRKVDGRPGACPGSMSCQELHFSRALVHPDVCQWSGLETMVWQASPPQVAVPAWMLWCM